MQILTNLEKFCIIPGNPCCFWRIFAILNVNVQGFLKEMNVIIKDAELGELVKFPLFSRN